jgi:hypothetical protein
MVKPFNKRKQNKLKVLLLAPICAMVFIIGWSLYCLGQSKTKHTQKTINKVQTKQEEVEIIMIPVQENEELTH